jgi:hypothetical protein
VVSSSTRRECESPRRFAVVRHRLKGDKEPVLNERLSDLDLHHPPCAKLNANRSAYTQAVLA